MVSDWVQRQIEKLLVDSGKFVMVTRRYLQNIQREQELQTSSRDDGYKSGYTQGTEYGKSLILTEIDLRIQEAERTNTNMPLFRVRQ